MIIGKCTCGESVELFDNLKNLLMYFHGNQTKYISKRLVSEKGQNEFVDEWLNWIHEGEQND
jgi:hypothetical protein